jgi:hypothetical protein
MSQVPFVESQRSDQVSDVSLQSSESDLMVNNLVYSQPKALSLAVNRTYKKQFFQRNDYKNGETAIIDLNTGSDYVDPSNSYLKFNIKATGTTGSVNWGSGSALNVIRQVTIRSRSGTELDRIERCNLWGRNDALYNYGNEYLVRFGEVQGFGPTRTPADPAVLSVGISTQTYCIPLNRIAPLFRPTKKGQKIPPQLASGMHIEIIFEDHRTAFVQSTTTDCTGYEISGIHIMTDQIALTDETQKTLNMESASTGLEYTYPRIYTAISSVPSAQLSQSVQVRKAVSQSCIAYATVLSQAEILDITVDSLAAVPYNTTRWQYRLGALYMPQQPIEDGSGVSQSGRESFINAMMVFDKLKHPFAESSVSTTEFVAGKALHCVSMEKDTSLNLSGLPVNRTHH